jgi:hypothetical protein
MFFLARADAVAKGLFAVGSCDVLTVNGRVSWCLTDVVLLWLALAVIAGEMGRRVRDAIA